MDKPKYWVKNVIKNVTQWMDLSIFGPNFGSNMDKPKYWVENVIKIWTNPMG